MQARLSVAPIYRSIMTGVVFDVYGWEMPEVPSASIILTPGPQSEKFIRYVDPCTVHVKAQLDKTQRTVETCVSFSPSCQGINHFDVTYRPGWMKLSNPQYKIWSLQFYMAAGSYALARVFHVERPEGTVLLDSNVQHVDAVANFSKVPSSYNSVH